jgi:hypothetical protein
MRVDGKLLRVPHAMVGGSSILRPTVGGSNATAAVSVSGTAYYVYLGKTARDLVVNFVGVATTTAGAGSQTAEVGLFSSTTEPYSLNATQGLTLTKIVATGTVDALTTANSIRRNTASFAQTVAGGTHLWAALRVAMTTTQPALTRTQADPLRTGALFSVAGSAALTSLTTVSTGTVLASTATNPYLFASV